MLDDVVVWSKLSSKRHVCVQTDQKLARMSNSEHWPSLSNIPLLNFKHLTEFVSLNVDEKFLMIVNAFQFDLPEVERRTGDEIG
jgi:hypothetical protein